MAHKKHVFDDQSDRVLIAGYRSGEAIDKLRRRMKIGRSTLYRRLNELDEPAREPRKASFYFRTIPECSKAHPIVRALFAEARKQGATSLWLANQTGVCRETLAAWRSHTSPMLVNVVAVANCLGLDIVCVEQKDFQQLHRSTQIQPCDDQVIARSSS